MKDFKEPQIVFIEINPCDVILTSGCPQGHVYDDCDFGAHLSDRQQQQNNV